MTHHINSVYWYDHPWYEARKPELQHNLNKNVYSLDSKISMYENSIQRLLQKFENQKLLVSTYEGCSQNRCYLQTDGFEEDICWKSKKLFSIGDSQNRNL